MFFVGDDGDFGEEEVAFSTFEVGHAGAASGEALVGDGFEAEGGEGLGLRGEFEGVGVEFLDVSGGEDDVVFFEGEVGGGGVKFAGAEVLPVDEVWFLGGEPGWVVGFEVFMGWVVGGEFGEEFFGLSEVGFLAVLEGWVGEVVVGFEGVVEVGEEAEVVVVGDGVVFVGVALGAAGGEAKPGGAGGGDAVGHGVVAEFEGVDAAFFVEHGVAVEAGGDELVGGGVVKHVSGELLDGELVEGLVGVEGADDVVAVGPDGAVAVFFVAIGVSVAGEVEPAAGPSFAVARGL